MMNEIKSKFFEQFQYPAEAVFSAPGRTELGGNHTDHQHGCVLAAAVNRDSRAAAAKNGEPLIRVKSEGYPFCTVDLNDLSVKTEEIGTTAALIRGVAARFAALGNTVCGFDAFVSSSVLPGSGLSSSAAFEVLIANIINDFSACKLSPTELAQIGQYAENVYFGKPCGLMDQMASSVGGVTYIDFADPKKPLVEKIGFDFSASGYTLCIIDSGSDHADLTQEYAAIPGELKSVCAVFGRDVLRQIPQEEFFARISEVRRAAGDRAVLRAIHYYEENERAKQEVQALKDGDTERFLALANASGQSSWMQLQNVIPAGETARQPLAFALALTRKLLNGRGACRVQGGGFAGTLQAFVPTEDAPRFCREIEAVLGQGCCQMLSVRQEGGMKTEETDETVS